MHFKINLVATALRFAAFTVILALPASVQAATFQVVVSYADLRISNPAGARALLGRLRAAARDVCGSSREMTYQACFKASLDQAVASVDAPMVSSLYHEPADMAR